MEVVRRSCHSVGIVDVVTAPVSRVGRAVAGVPLRVGFLEGDGHRLAVVGTLNVGHVAPRGGAAGETGGALSLIAGVVVPVPQEVVGADRHAIAPHRFCADVVDDGHWVFADQLRFISQQVVVPGPFTCGGEFADDGENALHRLQQVHRSAVWTIDVEHGVVALIDDEGYGATLSPGAGVTCGGIGLTVCEAW